jgi:VanZ family protein
MKFHSLVKFLPALVWMMIIFYFSSQSTAGIGHTSIDRFLILKSFHLIEYAILGVLVFYPIKKFRYTLLISYLYAISDEFHQSYTPGRTPKFTDTLIDLLGIFIGIFLISLIRKSYFLNHKSNSILHKSLKKRYTEL